jgi:hypothetical protein
VVEGAEPPYDGTARVLQIDERAVEHRLGEGGHAQHDVLRAGLGRGSRKNFLDDHEMLGCQDGTDGHDHQADRQSDNGRLALHGESLLD